MFLNKFVFKTVKKYYTMQSNQLETLLVQVDPKSIIFSKNAHISGEEPTITDVETKNNILKAAKILSTTDNTVAFPTETVYGLGGSSMNDESVRNIYRAKNRPSDNPLISHVSSIRQIDEVIYGLEHDEKNPLKNIPLNYHKIIKELWPGPLTILLPIKINTASVSAEAKLSKLTTGMQSTFAVRLPGNNIARALIHYANVPVAAPSANTSTKPSPTAARHVFFDLKDKTSMILDGGDCTIGVESTVLDCVTDEKKVLLLRPGGFTKEDIEEITKTKVEVECVLKSNQEKVRTPGMKYKHYAPSCKVVLFSPNTGDLNTVVNEMNYRIKLLKINPNDELKVGVLSYKLFDKIDFKMLDLSHSDELIVRQLGDDLKQMQKNIFKELRELDDIENIDLLFIEGVSEELEGLAIMNRLSKSAGSDIINF